MFAPWRSHNPERITKSHITGKSFIAVYVNWPRDLVRLVGVYNHMSPPVVRKQRSSLSAIRHENTPWDIFTTAGLVDFLFFRWPRKVSPMTCWPQFSQLGRQYCDWNIPCGTLDTATHYKIWVSLTQTPTSKKSLTTRKPYNKRFT